MTNQEKEILARRFVRFLEEGFDKERGGEPEKDRQSTEEERHLDRLHRCLKMHKADVEFTQWLIARLEASK